MNDALRVLGPTELCEPVMVLAFEGWNDAGESATTAARFLATELHAAPLAEIDPETFYDFTVRRPFVRGAGSERRIDWQHMEFQRASQDGVRDLVLGFGPEPHLRWRAFADAVVDLARRVGVRRTFLLGAYLDEVVYSRPVKVTGSASTTALADRLAIERSGYEGPTGIVGVLAERLRRAQVEVASLWVALPVYIEASPNPRGALALVHRLCDALDLRLDDAPLREAAGQFEQRVSELVAADPEIAEFVRQLKRREFAS